jgi:class 3 adenylate cyclase
MALGSTFCGVTGCSSVACRWDITGPPAVRAARLMQYALKQSLQMAIDQSVFDDPLASTRLKVLQTSVALKGSPCPVTVYTVSDTTLSSVFGILDTSYGKFL